MCYFPQRVDETLDAAGEDSSQAIEEADPGYIADEGKPPPKFKLRITHFYFPLYHLYCIMLVLYSYGLGLY